MIVICQEKPWSGWMWVTLGRTGVQDGAWLINERWLRDHPMNEKVKISFNATALDQNPFSFENFAFPLTRLVME